MMINGGGGSGSNEDDVIMIIGTLRSNDATTMRTSLKK